MTGLPGGGRQNVFPAPERAGAVIILFLPGLTIRASVAQLRLTF